MGDILQRCFPYTTLNNLDFLEVEGYIAGSTNPIFESHPEWWDVLCDIDSGRVLVSTTGANGRKCASEPGRLNDFDDELYLRRDASLQEGLTLSGIASDFARVHHLNWHPVTTLSWRIEQAWHGLDPGRTLASNVVLHALASVLLLLALTELTGSLGRSFFVAAVFALHPLHVESVAWASSRKDVLAGVAFAATLLAYARYARHPSGGHMGLVALFLGHIGHTVVGENLRRELAVLFGDRGAQLLLELRRIELA